jgi:hypothetical protein
MTPGSGWTADSGTPVPERVRQRYARVAGFTFLLYIAVALAESMLFDSAVGSGIASAKLAHAQANALMLRTAAVLSLIAVLCALVLGVALFVVTRDYDFHLALFGLAGRLAEGVMGIVYALPALGFISAVQATNGVEPGAEAEIVVAMLLAVRHDAVIFSATCFAAGSAAFSVLLLWGRAIPNALGLLGLLASAGLLIALPIQLAVDARGPATLLIWLPMLAFELVLAVWLLVRGVEPVAARVGTPAAGAGAPG